MRRKIEMKKIEEITKRQVTFSKRRSSLLKKAEEIAICCDVDVLFVALSPSGRLSKFSSQKRTEDMLERYTSLPIERRLTDMVNVQEKVAKLRQLNHIKGEVSKLHFLDKQIENFELQIKKSTLELQILNANIRDYEPRSDLEPSLHQLQWCERNLQESLYKVMARKAKLEEKGRMDVHFAAQQITPQQFDTNNWINPYSSTIQGSIYQNHWMDKGKRVANSSCNYTYTPSFASSSQFENISYSQVQNPSPHISMQNQQQNMVVDVQQSQAQTFGQSQAQITFGESSDNSITNIWHNICNSTRPMSSPFTTMGTQLNNPFQLGLEYAHSTWNNNINDNNNNNHIMLNDHSSVPSDAMAPNISGFNYSMEAQTTFGESSDNSIMNFWHNICNSTRPISSTLATTGTQLNNSSQLGLEYAHSTWNNNINDNNNNNHIIQHNDHSSVPSDAMAPNVSGFNYSMEEDTNMGNNEYFVEKSYDNDAWVLDDVFLNETFNGEEFRSLD